MASIVSPQCHEEDAIVVRPRQAATVAIRGQHKEFAARYLEYVA
jgi:hypothetical protein